MIISFLMEFVLVGIHEFPGLDFDVDVSLDTNGQGYQNIVAGPVIVRNPHALLMFLRVYLIARHIITHYYPYGSKVAGLWFQFEFTSGFAVRHMMAANAWTSLILSAFLMITMCAYSEWVCDRNMGGVRSTMALYSYLVVATITTVGYGDIVPVTHCSRAIAVMSAFFGIAIVAGITSAILGLLNMMPYEYRVIEFLESAPVRNNVLDMASTVIAKAWYFYKAKKNGKSGNDQWQDLIFTIFDWNNMRNEIKSYAAKYGNEDLMRILLTQTYGDTRVLVKNMRRQAAEHDVKKQAYLKRKQEAYDAFVLAEANRRAAIDALADQAAANNAGDSDDDDDEDDGRDRYGGGSAAPVVTPAQAELTAAFATAQENARSVTIPAMPPSTPAPTTSLWRPGMLDRQRRDMFIAIAVLFSFFAVLFSFLFFSFQQKQNNKNQFLSVLVSHHVSWRLQGICRPKRATAPRCPFL